MEIAPYKRRLLLNSLSDEELSLTLLLRFNPHMSYTEIGKWVDDSDPFSINRVKYMLAKIKSKVMLYIHNEKMSPTEILKLHSMRRKIR